MNDSLEEVIDEGRFGLAHRVRYGQPGSGIKAPCLVLLHGVGANEAGFIGIARDFDPRWTVVLARGPLAFAPGQFGWFQVSFTATGPAIDAYQAESSRRRLLAFIEALPEAYGADPSRIWIAGFSQGGIMSASVALTEPDKLAGFAILSGRILPEIRPLVQDSAALKRLRAFISHGIRDQKLGIHFARDARTYLEGLGVPLEYREYEAGHELNLAMYSDFQAWLTRQVQ